MSFRKTRRLISIVISICFLFTEIVWANPALTFPVGQEVQEGKYVPMLEIPTHLGTVEEIHYPESKNAPFIIHVQTVHGHYETAVKIKDIIHYLKAEYGTNLLFAEGASEDLHPEFLKFLSDPEQNLKVIDALAQRGELTGVDLALLDPSIQALGIENPDLYREAYQAFKKVISNLNQSEAYLEKERLEIDKKASKAFSRELRDLVSEWLKFNSGRRDLMATIKFLRKEAKDSLDLDFENPFSQFDWPQLTRIVLLHELEKRLDEKKFKEERRRLTEWLKSKGLPPELFPLSLKGEGQGEGGMTTRHESPRQTAEKFLEDNLSKGFQFRDYPQITYRTAHKVLESELDAKPLFEEFDKLFDELFGKVTTTEDERTLIQQYKDLILLQKLLMLELTPADWEKIRARSTEHTL